MDENATPTSTVDTILFVDVDGVLNVGIYDPFDAPILLKSSELSVAREIVAMDYRGFDSATAYKICALANTPADEDASATTFEALASQDQLSKVLVGRLSELIQDAGPKCHVVLSSSWRKRQHLKRREKLELDLSEALGRYFTFDDVTCLAPELHAGDRLQVIRKGSVRAYFVEDFLVQPLEDMGIDAAAKVLHCYRKVVANGMVLQVGIGLSNNLLKDGKSFLSDSSPEAATEKSQRLAEPQIEKSFFQLLATFA
eukprot:Skav204163  [mRNA]  locus=scaffold903:340726:345085:+ [translate_table: standard]